MYAGRGAFRDFDPAPKADPSWSIPEKALPRKSKQASEQYGRGKRQTWGLEPLTSFEPDKKTASYLDDDRKKQGEGSKAKTYKHEQDKDAKKDARRGDEKETRHQDESRKTEKWSP